MLSATRKNKNNLKIKTMEFKRIEKAINDLEIIKSLNEITENGLEYLEELKLALSICNSCEQLNDKETTTFDDWLQENCIVDKDDLNLINYKGEWYFREQLIEEYKND